MKPPAAVPGAEIETFARRAPIASRTPVSAGRNASAEEGLNAVKRHRDPLIRVGERGTRGAAVADHRRRGTPGGRAKLLAALAGRRLEIAVRRPAEER